MSLLKLNDVSNKKNCDYIVYPLAKQDRLPFPKSVSTTSRPFDMIHMDVWGSYNVYTRDNKRYFFDDCG